MFYCYRQLFTHLLIFQRAKGLCKGRECVGCSINPLMCSLNPRRHPFFWPPISFLFALSTMPSTFQDNLQHPQFCADSFFCLSILCNGYNNLFILFRIFYLFKGHIKIKKSKLTKWSVLNNFQLIYNHLLTFIVFIICYMNH